MSHANTSLIVLSRASPSCLKKISCRGQGRGKTPSLEKKKCKKKNVSVVGFDVTASCVAKGNRDSLTAMVLAFGGCSFPRSKPTCVRSGTEQGLE